MPVNSPAALAPPPGVCRPGDFFVRLSSVFSRRSRMGCAEHCVVAAAIFRRHNVADGIQPTRLAHPRDDLWLCHRRHRGLSPHRDSQLDRTAAGQRLSAGWTFCAVAGRPRGDCRLRHLGRVARGCDRCRLPPHVRCGSARGNSSWQQLAQSPRFSRARRADRRQHCFSSGGNLARQRRLWHSHRYRRIDRT